MTFGTARVVGGHRDDLQIAQIPTMESQSSLRHRKECRSARNRSNNMCQWAWTAVIVLILALELTAGASPKAPKGSGEDGGDGGSGGATTLATKRGHEDKVKSNCKKPCGNGRCDEDKAVCQCYPGWRGDQCDQCGGKVKLNGTSGWLADAVGNYSVASKCTWLIEAPRTDSRIRLHLKDFATECGWDHLYVFDGDSVFADLRAVFSGMVLQDGYRVHRVPELVGHSGSVLLHFYSDVAYNMTGFNITFGIDDCPSEHHDATCSGHGTCNHRTGRCVCDQDFVGPACARPACPNNCRDAGGTMRGVCLPREKMCNCFPGWKGESCSQAVSEGYWEVLSPNLPPSEPALLSDDDDEEEERAREELATQRTSHTAMTDHFGRMWVVGGETFTPKTRYSKNFLVWSQN